MSKKIESREDYYESAGHPGAGGVTDGTTNRGYHTYVHRERER